MKQGFKVMDVELHLPGLDAEVKRKVLWDNGLRMKGAAARQPVLS